MSNRIGFAFDLHGTLTHSNEAWIKAYVSAVGSDTVEDQVTKMVYQKESRKAIAQKLGVDYELVLERYHELVEPDSGMCLLVDELAKHFPVFLISSAQQEKVQRDLKTLKIDNLFTAVFHKSNFCKSLEDDWNRLILDNNLDMLFYVGNDIKEDIICSEKVCVLLSGSFFNSLDKLGMLYNREMGNAL